MLAAADGSRQRGRLDPTGSARAARAGLVLVAEHNDLELFELIRAESQRRELQNAPKHQVTERPAQGQVPPIRQTGDRLYGRQPVATPNRVNAPHTHGHRGCDRFRSIGLSARRFCRWPVRLGSAEGWARRQGFVGAARHPSSDEAWALACTGFADEQWCQLRAATPPRERRPDAAVTTLIRRRSHQGGARLGRLQPPSRTYPLVGLAVDDVATAGEVARANLCLPEHGAHSQACSDA